MSMYRQFICITLHKVKVKRVFISSVFLKRWDYFGQLSSPKTLRVTIATARAQNTERNSQKAPVAHS